MPHLDTCQTGVNGAELPVGRPADAKPDHGPSPSCYSLIWDHELPALRYIFEAAARQREAVLKRWHHLYLLHFGESRSLPDRAFFEIFGAELDAITSSMMKQDLDRTRDAVRKTSERLRERRVPFEELAVSMHVFEQSILSAFPQKPAPEWVNLRLALDKLTHCLNIVAADAYLNVERNSCRAGVRRLPDKPPSDPSEDLTNFHGMIGATSAMRALYQRIGMAANTRGTVLIVGETGTGKELVAHAIHECGLDPDSPFVALNSAALPKELIESELFGYKRGAFSGAREDYLGLFRAAEGGTLFLDEITEMGPDVQSKLLRALQEKTVRPMGSQQELPVNARVIASTNLDPEHAVETGALRADLYYRLQASVLNVPALRERRDDIPPLADHFLKRFTEKSTRSQPVTEITDQAGAALKNYWWPGNVRELANAIESAATFARGSAITRADLPAAVLRPSGEGPVAHLTLGCRPVRYVAVPTWDEVEREVVCRALQLAGGNQSRAAKMLRISRKKLRYVASKCRLL